MPINVDDGLIVLLDPDNQPVTEPQPCQFAYDFGPGRYKYNSFSCRIRSHHTIPVPKGAVVYSVGLKTNDGRFVCAYRVLPASLEARQVGQQFTIIPDPNPVRRFPVRRRS